MLVNYSRGVGPIKMMQAKITKSPLWADTKTPLVSLTFRSTVSDWRRSWNLHRRLCERL